MGTLWQDIRYACRMLGRRPGLTVVAVISLALGIGTNTALFSVIHGVLLRPLPLPEPDRLVWLRTHHIKSGGEGSVSAADYRDWAEQNEVFEHMAAWCPASLNLTGQGDPAALKAWSVTHALFDTFDCQPLLGRGFSAETFRNDESQTVVLSHGLWRSRFASEPEIVGRPVTLDGRAYTVIGVAGPELDAVTNGTQAFVPISADTLNRPRWDHFLRVVGRLRQDVTLDQAQSEMVLTAQRLAQQYPDDNEDKSVRLTSLQTYLVRDFSTSLWVLYGAVTFLLLLACVNVTSLMLVKAGARDKEMTIRRALGAGRMRLISQLLTESAVLTAGACVLGWCLAYWITAGLDIIAPQVITQSHALSRVTTIGLNGEVLGFSVLISALTALGVGLVPARHAARTQSGHVLNVASQGSGRRTSRQHALQALVSGEIALALILLMGAGLLIQSLLRLQHAQPGFQAHGILAAHLELPDAVPYDRRAGRTTFYMEAARRLAILPGVQSAAVINHVPLIPPFSSQGFKLEGGAASQEHGADYRQISPGYFETMGIPLICGRSVSPGDIESGNSIVIVNQAFVDKYLPDTEPIGKHILHWDTPKEIVGVVGNVKFERLHAREFRPAMYEPIDQGCWRAMTLVVRSSGNPSALTDTVRREIQRIAPNQPILRFDNMGQVLEDATALDRFCTLLLGCMAGVALLLALIGIFGVTAHYVSERTREIGVRVAVGARASDILSLVLRKGLMLIGAGTIIGVLGAFALSRFMSGLLFEVKPTDPATFVLVPVLLAVVALCACYLPARRAAKIDPMEALRYE